MDASLTRILIMAALPAFLWALPIRFTLKPMLLMAFTFWVAGGCFLVARGLLYLWPATLDDSTIPALGMALALGGGIGIAKGLFVLSKTSARNIERLKSFEEPKKAIAIYGLRSWIMIALMLGISFALNLLPESLLWWRGVITLAVGMALIASSVNYLKASKEASSPV
jgi:hypothetical protein